MPSVHVLLRRPLMLLLVCALAACGGSGDDGDSEGNAPAERQVLRVNFGTEPPSLDPGLVTDVTSANVVGALMDPLVKLGDELEPVGSMAERWELSDDGKVVTFHLRDDGRWTNGDPLTAEDFEWSWKRTISPELGADYAYQFYGIVGAEAYNSCEADCDAARDAVAVEATDERTLRVELTSPQPWFVQQVAHTSFNAVHRATVEQHGEKWTEPGNIVTSGPFRLAGWKHDESITLEKWPEWRDAGSVELERLEGRMITDATTAIQAFRAGEIDACVDRETCIPPTELDAVREGDEYVQNPALATQFVAINAKNVPDPNQRRALALAIDRTSIVENITKGDEEPASSFTPKGMPGFDRIRQDFLPATADLEQARALLDRAQAPKRTLTLVTSSDEVSHDVAVALQAMWKELGLEIEIRSMEWAQFLEFIGPPPNAQADLIWIGWVGDFVDDINFLDLWTCGGGLNFTGWCEEEYDRLITQARSTLDDDERHGIYAELESMLTGPEGAMPIVPVFWNTTVLLRKPWVRGWEQNLLAQFDFTEVSIEEH